MPYLIDSDVRIDISHGKAAAGEYINALPEGWAISQVSVLEPIVVACCGHCDGRGPHVGNQEPEAL